MTDLHDELARISLLQGRAPIDGTRIEGDGEPWPPMEAPPDPIEETPPWMGDDGPGYVSEPAPDLGPTPMLEPATSEPQASGRVADFADFLAGIELMVHDNAAMYKARVVELSPEERNKVVRVVLGAIARDIDKLKAELGIVPRKRRPRSTAHGNVAAPRSSESLSAPGPVPTKRRGRPKKVRQALDGTVSQ